MAQNNKEYLGDGVYISDDGFQFRITTENGVSVQNEVFMEPLVVESLIKYIAKARNLNIKATKLEKLGDPLE